MNLDSRCCGQYLLQAKTHLGVLNVSTQHLQMGNEIVRLWKSDGSCDRQYFEL